MNLFLILLLIPLSFAGSPPDCTELGKILEGYEKDLQKKFFSACKDTEVSDLLEARVVLDPDFLSSRKCSDLATIEAELETLKLEEGVLRGIDKLKHTIERSKNDTKSTNTKVALEAGKTFLGSLNTAASLELMLQTTTEDNVPLLQKLKSMPEITSNHQKEMSDRIAEICKEQEKSKENACNNSKFILGPEAAQEINELIKNANVDIPQLAKWQNMLAIKKKNVPEGEDDSYSFAQMQDEFGNVLMALDEDKTLTKEELNKIKSINDFENSNEFGFVKRLSYLKEGKELQIETEKFLVLVGDSHLRQQYEVQSKVSVLWENMKNRLPDLTDEDKADCADAKMLFTSASKCIDHIKRVKSKTQGDDRANLERLLTAIDNSKQYAMKLDQVDKTCRGKMVGGIVPKECFQEMEKDLASVQDKILQLNVLKDKIMSENTKDMSFRNLALYKWGQQKCKQVDSNIDFCEPDAAISKEAMMTVSDTMKIALVFAPRPQIESEMEVMCSELEKPTRIESRLCEEDTVSDIVENDKTPFLELDGPITAPDGGHDKARVRDAWIQGGAQILGSVMNYHLNRVMPPMNVPPYPYNYPPFKQGAPVMGIADQITFNARHLGGHGLYLPTAGYEPHKAFGANSSFSSYKPASPSASKYFSF